MSYSNTNRVILVGRLTRDPELRSTAGGCSVCGLRIACNGFKRDEEGGYEERPNFFDVSVFGSPAENVSRYLSKGARVAIDGRLEWREWETAEQERRQSVGIVADHVEFLDSPGGSQDGSEQPGELIGAGAGVEVPF